MHKLFATFAFVRSQHLKLDSMLPAWLQYSPSEAAAVTRRLYDRERKRALSARSHSKEAPFSVSAATSDENADLNRCVCLLRAV